MRITIGGILLVGGIATIAVLGPLDHSGDLLKQAVDGVTSLVKSVSGPAVIPAPTAPAANNSNTVSSGAAVVSTNTVEASTSTVVVQPSAAAIVSVEKAVESEPAEPVAQAAPVRRASRRRRRSRRKRTAAVKATAATKPATAAPKAGAESDDPLIGRYVSVKLKSGREVKGVLRERSVQGITLEIPGMGPFQYPNSNIDGVKAAE